METKHNEAILLHNAGGCSHFLDDQYQMLQQHGLKTISPDLPGHGKNSDTPKASVEDIAKDLWLEADKAGLTSPIIIGLNYGACIGIEMSAQRPQSVSALILLDPPLLMDKWVIQLIKDHIAELNDESFVGFAEHLVNNVMKNENQQHKKMAISSFQRIKRKTLADVYTGLLDWDKLAREKLSQCKIPILHAQSEHPFCQESALNKICPQVKTIRLPGTGPWLSLDAPEDVNMAIQEFLDEHSF